MLSLKQKFLVTGRITSRKWYLLTTMILQLTQKEIKEGKNEIEWKMLRGDAAWWFYILFLYWLISLYGILFFMAFVLQSVLSDMSISTTTFSSFPFPWRVFFHSLTFSMCVSFALKCVSCRQHIVGSCFIIHYVILCLFIGAFSLLTFKVIIDSMYLLPF